MNYYQGISEGYFLDISDIVTEKLTKYGAEPVKALDRIKRSYEIAMADTDNRLLTQSNAKTTTRARKAADGAAPAPVAPAATAAPADKK